MGTPIACVEIEEFDIHTPVINEQKERRRARFTQIAGGKIKRIGNKFGVGRADEKKRGIFSASSFHKSGRQEREMMLARIAHAERRDDGLADRVQDYLDDSDETVEACSDVVLAVFDGCVQAACFEGRDQIGARLKEIKQARAEKGTTTTRQASAAAIRRSKERSQRMALSARRRAGK
jgi:hypothetical protein